LSFRCRSSRLSPAGREDEVEGRLSSGEPARRRSSVRRASDA
jgi:hypothetical protein